MLRYYTLDQLTAAADALHRGGVLAYPTEAVFGLGCDPHDRAALGRLFELKQRPATQGVLLIAAEFSQLEQYIDLANVPRVVMTEVQASWPGPSTWVFPRSMHVPEWIVGHHTGIALRVTAHPPAAALCRAFGGALVSTSANPHGAPPARITRTVADYFGDALDGVVDAATGDRQAPSTIRDALSGAIIRA